MLSGTTNASSRVWHVLHRGSMDNRKLQNFIRMSYRCFSKMLSCSDTEQMIQKCLYLPRGFRSPSGLSSCQECHPPLPSAGLQFHRLLPEEAGMCSGASRRRREACRHEPASHQSAAGLGKPCPTCEDCLPACRLISSAKMCLRSAYQLGAPVSPRKLNK